MMLTHSDFVGVYAIIPTPATPDAERWDATDTVDLVETERVVERLIADGVHGLIVLGTTGECATITRDEYEAFVDCVLTTSRGRIPTFIGTTQLGLHEVVYRTKFAQERGAAGILLGLPMWQPCTLDTAVEYYKTMSEAFPELSLMVYGNTRAFRFPFGPDFWEQIVAKAPTVTSAKFARAKDFPAAFAAAGQRVHFLPHESVMMKFFDMSPETTKACWSTAASLGPEPALAIAKAILDGDEARARVIARDLDDANSEFEERLASKPELFASFNLQAEKIRIDAAGYCKTGPIRPPYHVVPDEIVEIARQYARNWIDLRKKYAPQSTTV